MSENKVELRPHKAKNVLGIEISFDQDLVYVNDYHVGYLCHKEGSPIMAITHLIPAETWQEIAAECSIIRSHEVKVPIPYYVPPSDDSEEDAEVDE